MIGDVNIKPHQFRYFEKKEASARFSPLNIDANISDEIEIFSREFLNKNGQKGRFVEFGKGSGKKTFKTQIKNWAKIDLEKDAELNAQTKNIKSATDKKPGFLKTLRGLFSSSQRKGNRDSQSSKNNNQNFGNQSSNAGGNSGGNRRRQLRWKWRWQLRWKWRWQLRWKWRWQLRWKWRWQKVIYKAQSGGTNSPSLLNSPLSIDAACLTKPLLSIANNLLSF